MPRRFRIDGRGAPSTTREPTSIASPSGVTTTRREVDPAGPGLAHARSPGAGVATSNITGGHTCASGPSVAVTSSTCAPLSTEPKHGAAPVHAAALVGERLQLDAVERGSHEARALGRHRHQHRAGEVDFRRHVDAEDPRRDQFGVAGRAADFARARRVRRGLGLAGRRARLGARARGAGRLRRSPSLLAPVPAVMSLARKSAHDGA
ncbi:hypothetical protein [Nannocystis pusilla]|uniref:hypothetical protein n=1 Tax=Nannocystis pusilla TaxID=889268 RepID=UPI003B779879